MSTSRLGFDATGESLDRASEALQEADDSLAGDIANEMTLLANRLADVARRRVVEEPIHGGKQTGLRADLAAGIKVVEIPGGASVTGTLPGSHGQHDAALPHYTDDYLRGWRHPVFGNRNIWVNEQFSFSWFTDSMQGGQDDGQEAIKRLLDEAADKIAEKTSG